MAAVDIYHWSKQLEYTHQYLKRGAVRIDHKRRTSTLPLSPRNIELILAFDEQKALEQCSIGWRIRLMTMLITMARILRIDFDTATKEDIRRLIVCISTNPRYAGEGKAKFRATFKMFYKWLKYGESYRLRRDYPDEVNWIAKDLHTRDQPHLQPTDLWTEDEIHRLIEVADHPMWRAFLSVLTETGARVGDIANRQLRDLYHDTYSFLLHIEGKSANPRENRIITASADLATWLNLHPFKGNPEAPLWVHPVTHKPLTYRQICRQIRDFCDTAGIAKRHNCHIFRHSRVTLYAKQPGMNDQMLKTYFGWTPDSKVLGRYSHLRSDDANDVILRLHGIKKAEDAPRPPTPPECPVCKTRGSLEDAFCRKCGRPFTATAALSYTGLLQEGTEVLNRFMARPEVQEALKGFLRKEQEKLEAVAVSPG